ncbi:MAG TPA: ATP phosphoribosyltransferase [Acholeplasmataceae bacterium]|nr:ATP phosphoribosyltransferase [Acholeplasmataceae bacterium]HBO67288.1 ATP phosphoribosyltransferase [Acholeplasmataceae bacterium]HBS01104.1 ATP phosphoribosyltransferase [Acholeplasmataceae bacterium]HCB20458.1 ATP phosphoribosyltransferase [Acholeplasmataceae bacterium]HCZ24170.1 ATP phosphoribosyltransferase [Acholeplasmataceae bacterium]
MNPTYLTIALPKGRLGDEAIQRFKAIGYGDAIDSDSRKLVFVDEVKKLTFMLVKPSDVITYVEKGVADLGIIGSDSLLEDERNLYELLPLGFGYCYFAVAGKKGEIIYQRDDVLKIATKYPNVTKAYFKQKNQAIEVIKLNGSVELAPLVGLSDVIVDIVETGKTLIANGLDVIEKMMDVSARLISNPVSYRFKNEIITDLMDQLKKVG